MLHISQALELYDSDDLGNIGINLHLWQKAPKQPKEALLAQVATQLASGVNWDSTGRSLPLEAKVVLLTLAIWPSAVAPDAGSLTAAAAALHPQTRITLSLPAQLRDRLLSTLRDLRNLGVIYWVPWRELLTDGSPAVLANDGWTGALVTDSGLFQRAYYAGVWTRDGWSVPPQILAALLPYLWPETAKGSVTQKQPSITRGDGLACLYDLAQLVAAAYQPGLRLTKAGPLYKRDQEMLMSRFLIRDTISTASGFSGRPDDQTPFYLQWVLAWAETLGLIEVGDGHLLSTRQGEGWMALSLDDQLTAVFDVWRRLIVPASPGLLLVLAALLWAPEDQWLDLAPVLSSLGQLQANLLHKVRIYQSPLYSNGRGMRVIQTALAALVYMGCLELGTRAAHDPDGPRPDGSAGKATSATTRTLDLMPMLLKERRSAQQPPSVWARLTPMGRSLLCTGAITDTVRAAAFPPATTSPLVVQPNYEVLVPPLTPTQVHWRLCQIADLLQPDQAYVYRISRESVVRGLRAGWTEADILQFLTWVPGEGGSAAVPLPLPQNVEFSIRDWCQGYGQCTVMRIAVVQCKTPELARRLLAEGTLKDIAIGRVSPTAILIRDDRLPQAINLLEKAGLPPPAEPVYVTEPAVAQRHGMGLPASEPET